MTVQDDDINKNTRIFKKKVLNPGILNEVHERQFFTKKSEKEKTDPSLQEDKID